MAYIFSEKTNQSFTIQSYKNKLNHIQSKIPQSKQVIKDLNDKLNRSVDIDIHQQSLNRIQILEEKCEQ